MAASAEGLDLYSDIADTISDWLTVEGGSVTDLKLDLINRSIRYISRERDWDLLETYHDFVLDSNNEGPFPTNVLKIISVFVDVNGNNNPDFYYFKDNGRISRGFKVFNTFLKATGNDFKISFFLSPNATPKMRYKKVLPPFVGTGTEYSIFPKDLVNACAHMLIEFDNDKQSQAFKTSHEFYNDQLNIYGKDVQQQNESMDTSVKDSEGRNIVVDDFSMDGDLSRQHFFDDASRDSDGFYGAV